MWADLAYPTIFKRLRKVHVCFDHPSNSSRVVNVILHSYIFHHSTRLIVRCTLNNSVNMTIILFIFTFSHRNFFFFQISYNIICACYVYMFYLQRWAVYICLSWNNYQVLFCSIIILRIHLRRPWILNMFYIVIPVSRFLWPMMFVSLCDHASRWVCYGHYINATVIVMAVKEWNWTQYSNKTNTKWLAAFCAIYPVNFLEYPIVYQTKQN